jgi:hypothetical protein
MFSFFDKNLFQQVVSGLIVLLVSIWLGGKATSTPLIGKGWKLTIIISWVMILGGLYIMASTHPNGGWSNPYVAMGAGSFIIGLALNRVGKFFDWWHH